MLRPLESWPRFFRRRSSRRKAGSLRISASTSGSVPCAPTRRAARPVFTDGFEFHGSPTSDGKQLQTDVKQRGAIVRASKPMRVWSLTYKDVERADGSAGSFWSSPFGERTDGVLPERLKYLESRAPVCARRGAFDALLRCLDEPEPEKEPRLDVAAAIALYAAPGRFVLAPCRRGRRRVLGRDQRRAERRHALLGARQVRRARSTAPAPASFPQKDPRQFAFFTFAGRSVPAGERRGRSGKGFG